MERLEEVMIKLGFSTDSSVQIVSEEPGEVNGKATQAISCIDAVYHFIFLKRLHLTGGRALSSFPFSLVSDSPLYVNLSYICSVICLFLAGTHPSE